MGPYVEEFAMAHTQQGKGDRIDVAGVPVCGRWNTRISAPAVLVDAGDDTMITILEADIGGVDLGGRGQRAIQQIAALLSTEITGMGGSQLPEKAQRAFGVLD